ncbi:MAG: hypothetical protein AAFY72_13260, partial [Cyanobacteria bacterium J06649_4]
QPIPHSPSPILQSLLPHSLLPTPAQQMSHPTPPKIPSHTGRCRSKLLATCGLLGAMLIPTIGWASLSWAQGASTSRVLIATVNSATDGPIQADESLTLREAISLINGTLSFSELSRSEQQLVEGARGQSEIRFNLPRDKQPLSW